MVRIPQTRKYGRHFIDEPRDIVPLAEERIPIDSCRCSITAIFDIGQIEDSIIFGTELGNGFESGREIFRLIQRHLEAFLLQQRQHLGKDLGIRFLVRPEQLQ